MSAHFHVMSQSRPSPPNALPNGCLDIYRPEECAQKRDQGPLIHITASRITAAAGSLHLSISHQARPSC